MVALMTEALELKGDGDYALRLAQAQVIRLPYFCRVDKRGLFHREDSAPCSEGKEDY